MELAFISEVAMCCRRCDALCILWLEAALLDVVLETICNREIYTITSPPPQLHKKL